MPCIVEQVLGRRVWDSRGRPILIEIDGTPDKSRLGGNATVATSIAALNLAAACSGVPAWRYISQANPVRMPLPQIQILGGGSHAGGGIDIQDLMIMPIGTHTFNEALSWAAEVYRPQEISWPS